MILHAASHHTATYTHHASPQGIGMTNGDRNVRWMKLGSLALLGGAGGVLLLWLVFLLAGSTSRLSGVDDVHGFLIRLTTAIPALLIILAHVAVARQLAATARERQ